MRKAHETDIIVPDWKYDEGHIRWQVMILWLAVPRVGESTIAQDVQVMTGQSSVVDRSLGFA